MAASELAVTCPKTFQCSGDGNVSFDIGRIPSYISITSSTLSCLGSLLILLTYLTLKDMRTGAQKVITLLAIADFFTAFGYIIGSTNFLVHFNEEDQDACRMFETVCEIQSFVTTWSTMCSYCWTCILAFYFFLVQVYKQAQLAARLIPLYNIIAWLSPLTIVLPLLATGKLGYAPYVASNWCYIRDSDYSTKLSEKPLIIALLFLAGKFWEIISYVLVMLLYVAVRTSMSKSRDQVNPKLVPKLNIAEKRLLAIPLLYIFLRMWGTLQFFYSLGVSGTINNGCIPQQVHDIFFTFGVLQAIGDGGQGWGNAVLYIFASSQIRKRLFCDPCKSCMKMSGRKLQTLGGKLTTVGERLVTVGVVHLEESQSSSLSESGTVNDAEQQHQRQRSGRVSNRAESSERAEPSEVSEPAPPVPISVVPGCATIISSSEELTSN